LKIVFGGLTSPGAHERGVMTLSKGVLPCEFLVNRFVVEFAGHGKGI
jgi:hypothetical protein